MKKRILCTLIFSLLVLTACSSETPNATPDEITPTAIIEMQTEEMIQQTTAPTEKTTEPTEVEMAITTAKTEQQKEVEIVERAGKTKAPALLKNQLKHLLKSQQKKQNKNQLNKNQTPVTMSKTFKIWSAT